MAGLNHIFALNLTVPKVWIHERQARTKKQSVPHKDLLTVNRMEQANSQHPISSLMLEKLGPETEG